MRLSDSLYLLDQQIGSIRLHAPAYKATVSPGKQSFSVFGQTMALQPGMGLQVEINKNKMRLIDRLFAAGDRSNPSRP